MEEVQGAFITNHITLSLHRTSQPLSNLNQEVILHSHKDTTSIATTNNDSIQTPNSYKLSFSECYQRYILSNPQTNQVEQSFCFLDDALRNFPNATFVEKRISQSNQSQEEQLQYLSSFTANPIKGGQTQAQIYNYLMHRITPDRIENHHTKAYLKKNFDRLMDLFTRGQSNTLFRNPGLAMDQHMARNVISTLPQILLYDYSEIEERVQFLMNPKPLIHTVPGVDWPKFSSLGYGAGLSIQQATLAIQNIPQLLSCHYKDSPKYSLAYFLRTFSLSPSQIGTTKLQLESYLIGSDLSDTYAFAVLVYKLGLTWDTCSILLEAFPTLTYCDLDLHWEVLNENNRKKSKMILSKNKLEEEALAYLRKRLGIGTNEVLGMIKTHSRLSTYSVEMNVDPTLNTIQSALSLSSSELRQVILRMPSLIGMGFQTFHNHVHFFTIEANMTISELKPAILKQPSLLQYSVDSSLRPKLEYLLETLSIPLSCIPRVLKTSPAILGLSFQNIDTTISTIITHTDLSYEQVGGIIVTSPPILTLGWKTKIEPMLVFLFKALFLQSKLELGFLVQYAPRILLQNIQRSIIPKLQMLEQAVEQELIKQAQHIDEKDIFEVFQHNLKQLKTRGTDINSKKSKVLTALIIRRNPSILCTTNDVFRRRLEKWNCKQKQKQKVCSRKSRLTLVEELAPSNKGRKRLYGPSEVLNPFKNRQDEISPPSSNISKFRETSNSLLPRALVPISSSRNKKIYQWDRIAILEETSLYSIETNNVSYTKENSTIPIPITVYVSGSVFPTDNIKEVRGQRRSGGISLYFPQIHHEGSKSIQSLFQSCSDTCFGTIMPETKGRDGSDYSCGIVSLGFPFLRPSRNRCDLYACYAALKVIVEMLNQAGAGEGRLVDAAFNIDVCTDSGYAWTMLQEIDRLAELGKHTNLDEFCNAYQSNHRKKPREECTNYNHHIDNENILKKLPMQKTKNLSFSNPDLLYAICLTLRKLKVYKSSIHFIHSGEMLGQNSGLDFSNQMAFFSKRAAMWQYSRMKII